MLAFLTITKICKKILRFVLGKILTFFYRILNTEFNEFCKTPEQAQLNFCPKSLRGEIDDLNTWIYE